MDLIEADNWLVYAPAVTVAPEAGRMNVADRVVAVIGWRSRDVAQPGSAPDWGLPPR